MRIGAYAAAIAALLLVSTGPRGAETLPAAIDDATFWKLIEDA
jgi:hypothetical protein